MTKHKQYCTFFVDGHMLAIDVLEVQEVIRYQRMTPVPTAPAVVRGLINLRGQLVTAIDLRRRLELSPAAHDKLPMNIVIRTDDGAVSLLVDEIGDVLSLDEADREMPPDTVPSVIRDFLIGIHQLSDRLLIVLDPEKLINVCVLPATIA